MYICFLFLQVKRHEISPRVLIENKVMSNTSGESGGSLRFHGASSVAF